MKVVTQQRNDEEWRAAHRRHISASDIPDALASRDSLRYRKLVERLALDFEGVGHHADEHPDQWQLDHEMQIVRGITTYSANERCSVAMTGLCEHDDYSWLAASPHGLIGKNGAVHIRARRTLRSFMERRTKLTEGERAKLATIMFVCDRAWIDVVDFWDGESMVPDRLHRKRVHFQYGWFADVVLSRITTLWRDVRATLNRRKVIS